MDTMHGDWGAGMGSGMWVFWTILVVVIAVIIRAVFGAQSNTTQRDSHNEALEILKERYASGDINDEKFEHRKNELEK